MKRPILLGPLHALAMLSGCVSYEPETWLNRGPITIDASRTGYCYTDANLIDGKRISGTLCATPTSGFLMKGEPEIQFGPWGMKFMKELVSNTTQGVEYDYQDKRVRLQCSPVLDSASQETGRDCTVTMNAQHLVSATFLFVPQAAQ